MRSIYEKEIAQRKERRRTDVERIFITRLHNILINLQDDNFCVNKKFLKSTWKGVLFLNSELKFLLDMTEVNYTVKNCLFLFHQVHNNLYKNKTELA